MQLVLRTLTTLSFAAAAARGLEGSCPRLSPSLIQVQKTSGRKAAAPEVGGAEGGAPGPAGPQAPEDRPAASSPAAAADRYYFAELLGECADAQNAPLIDSLSTSNAPRARCKSECLAQSNCTAYQYHGEDPARTCELVTANVSGGTGRAGVACFLKQELMAPPVIARASATTQRPAVEMEHRRVGCFRRSRADGRDAPKYMDETCRNVSRGNESGGADGTEPCRSGLPFYRLPLQPGQTYLDCFSFCLTKALDLSGIVDNSKNGTEDSQLECRCGASPENYALWHSRTPPRELMLRPEDALDSDDDPACEVEVWKYIGGLESEGVPSELTELSDADERYLHLVALGEHVHEDDGGLANMLEALRDVPLEKLSEENATALMQTASRGRCEDVGYYGNSCGNLRGYCNGEYFVARVIRTLCPNTCGQPCQRGQLRLCYPHSCGPGGGPWIKKATDGNVYIPYYYADIDAGRRQVVRQAMTHISDRTCVKFYESAGKPTLRIQRSDSGCYCDAGYPGSQAETRLNLGWCSTAADFGSIVHELGHCIGMNHEQQRPDGDRGYYVPGVGWSGPHTYVYWQNVPSGFEQWYYGDKENTMTFIGSSNRGFRPYDFDSIMHYGFNDNPVRYAPVNSANRARAGQRNGLSSGDIQQISDMYLCR